MKKLKKSIIITMASTPSPGFSTSAGVNFHAFISTGYLQTVDMRYNIRGQLLSLNNSKLSNDGGVTNNDNTDLFGMQFLYDQADANLGNTPSFDGKLTGVKWMSTDASGNPGFERAYRYSYDQLNRDTAAIYAERHQATTTAFTVTHGWDENRISYDQNGNLLSMFRMDASPGAGNHVPIDNLSYTYSSTNPNQLSTVTDATGNNAGFYNLTSSTTAYAYDANGNLTNDYYKGLTITYNYLNKTNRVTVTTGTNQFINYTYDGAGSLIRKQAYNNGTLQTTTDYVDGFVYVNSTLQYFPMPEGRVINSSGTLKQEFIITDQQGNARLAFQDSGNGTPVVTQENSYYAFGLIMPNSPVATPAIPNKNLYNGGSEWQNDYSNNLPDYYQTYFRNYDAAIGRFIGIDPSPESAESMTGYNYAGDNPVMMNDPMGDKAAFKVKLVTGGFSSGGGGDNDGLDSSDDGGGGSGDPYDQIGRTQVGTGFDNSITAITAANNYQNALSGGEGTDAQAAAQQIRSVTGLNPSSTFNTASQIYASAQAYVSQPGFVLTYNALRGYSVGYNGYDATATYHGVPDGYGGLRLADVNIVGYSVGLGFGTGGSEGGNSNPSVSEGLDYEKIGSAITTGADSYGVALSKANVINTIVTGTKIEGKAFKYLTGSGTVVGAIAGGIPAAISIYKNGLNLRNGTAASLAILGLVSEFTGLGEAYDGTVGLAVTAISLAYDIWDAKHPIK